MSEAGLIASGDREAALDALERERFDCVVIGGGITGAGIARELARRGRTVALLEAEDFAAGTSSRSSKLIHGGLRYLAMGDVALVRETALERKVVHRLAPHLAEPCWMVVPTRSRAGLVKFRAGLGTYERLGAIEDADRHRVWSGETLAENEPALDRERYPWACAYREYLTDDARLVLANLRAAAGQGAHVLSRVRVEGFVRDGSGQGEPVTGVEARCATSGRRVRVHAQSIVNAAGPWVGAVRALESSDSEERLLLSKGVHAVLPASVLPVRHLVILGTEDRRSIFAIPRGEVVYLGTTDTAYEGSRRYWPEVTRDDVAYLLAPLSRYFALDRVLSPGDVIAAWSGLRPLIAQPGKAPKEISRRDEVWVGSGGVVTIAGGKLTGYRKMALQVTARVLALLGVAGDVDDDPGPPLPGGDFAGSLDALAASLAGVDARTATRLVRLYGADARSIVARDATTLAGAPIVAGEVDWAVEREAAHTLEDLVYRRTRVAWYEPAARAALLEPMAERMSARLGWDDARRASEIEAVRARFDDELALLREG